MSYSVTLWTVAHQAPLSMGYSRQKYWSGLLRPPSGTFLSQGPNLLLSPAGAVRFFTPSATWEALVCIHTCNPTGSLCDPSLFSSPGDKFHEDRKCVFVPDCMLVSNTAPAMW